jgi:hypothetical protein
MEVVHSAAKQGLLLYPSFTMKTAGKEGKVYFFVMFFDANGNPIKDNDDKYNINGVVGTYRSFTVLPEKRLGANKIALPTLKCSFLTQSFHQEHKMCRRYSGPSYMIMTNSNCYILPHLYRLN